MTACSETMKSKRFGLLTIKSVGRSGRLASCCSSQVNDKAKSRACSLAGACSEPEAVDASRAAHEEQARAHGAPDAPGNRDYPSTAEAFGRAFFSNTGQTVVSGFSNAKEKVDACMRAELSKANRVLKPWAWHDLRRTAKTLMSRQGVRSHVSERVLGHVIAGVEGVYDRYEYLDEKCDGLEKLAAIIDRIIKFTGQRGTAAYAW